MYVWECLLLYVTEYNYSVLINIFLKYVSVAEIISLSWTI